MASNLPLRTSRIPAFQRQCLFQHRRHVQSPRAFSTTTPQLFASTVPRLRGQSLGQGDKNMTKSAVKGQSGPAPRVNMEKAQQDIGSLADDIGLLQDTIIRARFSQLPGPWSPRFWGYFWKLLKSKVMGLYSRCVYHRCIYNKGLKSYTAIDAFNRGQLKATAKILYKQIYTNFAKGDMKPISRLILPPLARNFQNRIDARGPLKMEWEMKKCTARIVSHRASLIGDQSENTGYRQVVFRLDSKQVLTLRDAGSKNGWMPHASRNSSPKGLRWVPEQATKKGRDVEKTSDRTSLEFTDNGETKRVVEYLVLQKRVVKGKEEDWKVWGFAQESTPEVIEEDDAYWRKTMAAQAEQA